MAFKKLGSDESSVRSDVNYTFTVAVLLSWAYATEGNSNNRGSIYHPKVSALG